MDELHKEVLQKMLPYLMDNLDARAILPQLFSKAIVNSQLYEEVNHCNTAESRTRYLVMCVLFLRGPDAYHIFVEILEKNHLWVSQALKQKEQDIRREKKMIVSKDATSNTSKLANLPVAEDTITPCDEIDSDIAGMTLEAGKIPLTNMEKIKLFGLYNTWKSDLDSKQLISQLPPSCISHIEEQLKDDNSDHAEVLFYHVLMKSYQNLCDIFKVLSESKVDSQRDLAAKLPNRTAELELDLPPPIPVSDLASIPAGGDPSEFTTPVNDTPELPISMVKAMYGFGEGHPRGTGLCVIVSNFTKHLVGYEKDAKELELFFKDTPSYTVMGPNADFNNMDKKRFNHMLKTIRKELNETKTKYDRFLLFVLSHGSTEGILMCNKGNGSYNPDDKYDVYATKDIVNMFSHDVVPSMANKPKCFFFQACRGSKHVSPIYLPANPGLDPGLYVPEGPTPKDADPVTMLAPGRDMLVCYPSAEEATSFVQANGSIFIQKCLEVFRKYHRTDHLIDMMVEVANLISSPEMYFDYRGQKVCQMPHLVSTLTKKLYLYNLYKAQRETFIH